VRVKLKYFIISFDLMMPMEFVWSSIDWLASTFDTRADPKILLRHLNTQIDNFKKAHLLTEKSR